MTDSVLPFTPRRRNLTGFFYTWSAEPLSPEEHTAEQYADANPYRRPDWLVECSTGFQLTEESLAQSQQRYPHYHIAEPSALYGLRDKSASAGFDETLGIPVYS